MSQYVVDHVTPLDEYWGQDAPVLEPNSQSKRGAVAPSVRAGRDLWLGKLSRDSETYICDIAWNKPRATVVINDFVVPAGFLDISEFWNLSRSLRMFNWGLHKYMRIYPDAYWIAPNTGTGATPDSAGCLRHSIVNGSLPKKNSIVEVKLAIARSLVRRGILKRVPFGAAHPRLRKAINHERLRKALLRCRFILRLSMMLRKRRHIAAPPPSGRDSPSLKRTRDDS